MKRFFLATVIIFIISASVSMRSHGGEPKLSSLTCKEYWEHHEASTNEKEMKNYFSDLTELWNYHVKVFKTEHSDLNHDIITPAPPIDEMKVPPFFIMFIYVACEMRQENLQKRLGDNLQENMYKMAFNEKRKKESRERGCNISDGVQSRLFEPNSDGVLTGCVSLKLGRVKKIILYDEEKSPQSIKLCAQPKISDQCQILEPNQENFCLSEFGDCTTIGEGKCGWAHTEKSRQCMGE